MSADRFLDLEPAADVLARAAELARDPHGARPVLVFAVRADGTPVAVIPARAAAETVRRIGRDLRTVSQGLRAVTHELLNPTPHHRERTPR